jgi:DNA repair protein RadB
MSPANITTKTDRLAIECEPLDELLDGGIEHGTITEFYGEAGSGKTNICLQLAKNEILRHQKKVIFIDTEGISIERLQQICGDEFDKVIQKILFFKPYDMMEQTTAVERAIAMVDRTPEIGLIIIDCATVFYRADLGTELELESRRALGTQLIKLLSIARKCNIPVVITNQVYTDVDTDKFEPLAGNILGFAAKSIISLERTDDYSRRATLIKHRSLPEGQTTKFIITKNGLQAVNASP